MIRLIPEWSCTRREDCLSRQPRLNIAEGVDHVTQRGVEQREIVVDDKDRWKWQRLRLLDGIWCIDSVGVCRSVVSHLRLKRCGNETCQEQHSTDESWSLQAFWPTVTRSRRSRDRAMALDDKSVPQTISFMLLASIFITPVFGRSMPFGISTNRWQRPVRQPFTNIQTGGPARRRSHATLTNAMNLMSHS